MFSTLIASELIATADYPLSRADMHSLTDQMRMELLIENLAESDKRRFQDGNGDFADACSWYHVTCDAESNVQSVEMYFPDPRSKETGSTIDMSFIPQKAVEFRANRLWLCGTLETPRLPPALTVLDIPENHFSGTVDLTSLPGALIELFLSFNQFHGSCALHSLPPALEVIHCNANKLSGSLDLTKLPSSLQELHLSNNQFSGEINLEHLPASMLHLMLENNRLSGSVVLNKLPEGINQLFLQRNKFSGRICLDKCSKSLHGLRIEDNNFCVEYTSADVLSREWDIKATNNSGKGTSLTHAEPYTAVASGACDEWGCTYK